MNAGLSVYQLLYWRGCDVPRILAVGDIGSRFQRYVGILEAAVVTSCVASGALNGPALALSAKVGQGF